MIGFNLPDNSDDCPACGGVLQFMGILGKMDHYRCRHCGINFNQPVPTKKEDTEQ